MSKFFNKKNSSNNEPEDFVLFNSEDNSAFKPAPSLDDTDLPEQSTETIDTAVISKELESINTEVAAVSPAPPAPKKKKGKKPRSGLMKFMKKHKVLSVCLCSLLIAAIIAGTIFSVVMLSDPMFGYTQAFAEKQNIMRTMSFESTLESGDRYEITSLVNGKVIQADFEVGDTVNQNDLLFQLDDTDAKLAVERAMNESERANDTTSSDSSSPTVYRILASEEGTVQSLNIKTGSLVSPGSQIGTLIRPDGSKTIITSYVSGSVSVVSVSTGQSLSAGQVIASINPTNSTDERNSTYDIKTTDIDLQAAQRQLDNYSIESPIDGYIVEVNAKVGDNVGVADTDKPMMVILDTSKLTFKFNVDSSCVHEFKKGQVISATSESVPDTDFQGEITMISTEGIPTEDGKLVFEVTATISNPGSLKSGMKISATTVLSSKKNVLSVPTKSLINSNGTTAFVIVKSATLSEDAIDSIDETEYPDIKVPDGCELLSVEYGTFDDAYVEIKSGLELGDIVVFDPKTATEPVTPKPTDNTAKKASSKEKNKSSESDLSIDDNGIDPEMEADIESQIHSML